MCQKQVRDNLEAFKMQQEATEKKREVTEKIGKQRSKVPEVIKSDERKN
jgi:hypothetical protein